jgi:nitrogenase molybdenum-iron protein beta chain
LPGGIPITHAAPGCAGNLTWTQFGGAGLQSGGYCAALSVPSSNIQEREVVFGGHERLHEQIGSTLDVINGGIYAVLTGCVPEMIGDDIRSIVAEFRGRGVDIIAAETGGFKGNSYHGYGLVLSALFRDFVTRGTPRVQGRVNLWGVVPVWDVFWQGNLAALATLLGELGLKVNTFFTQKDDLETIRGAASAELNIVVSDLYGVEAAKVFQDVHGTDFLVHPLPVGPSASESFLQAVGARLALPAERVDRAVASQRSAYETTLRYFSDIYTDVDLQRYAVVIGDVNYAAALPKFLSDDFGWLTEVVVCTDPVDEEVQAALAARLEGLVVPPKLIFETDTSRILDRFTQHRPLGWGRYRDSFSPAFVVGSSLDRPFATAIGAEHLSVSFPVANRAVLTRGYAGFTGGLNLIEDLAGTIVAGR